jgi:hypothetical protein
LLFLPLITRGCEINAGILKKNISPDWSTR